MNAHASSGRVLPDLTETMASVGSMVRRTATRRSRGIDDKEMRRLFEEGMSDQEMASHFGYGIASIRQHRWALGLRRAPLTILAVWAALSPIAIAIGVYVVRLMRRRYDTAAVRQMKEDLL